MQDTESLIKKEGLSSSKFDSIETIKNVIDEHVFTNKEIALNQLNEIISLLPGSIRNLIDAGFKYKRIPKEYLLSSILFAFSNAAGLAFKIDCMNYDNYSNFYFALIGSRGDTKSPAIDLATAPLNEYDNEEYKSFKEQEKALNDLADENAPEVIRKRLFVQNATIEGAMFAHYKNPYSIGILIDELSFLIEKMANKNSPEGAAWRTLLLQGSTNKHIDVLRKVADSYRLEKSYPTLLGSIQHQFIPKMFANGNLESGLIDRLLFTTKLTSNKKICKEKFPSTIKSNYNILLINLFKYRRSIEENNQEFNVLLSDEANSRVIVYSQKLLNKQDSFGDYEKEYVSKMMINIHKLVLLVHLIKNATTQTFQEKINIESVVLAIKLNEFFFTNFKLVLEGFNSSFSDKDFTINAVKMGIINDVAQKEIVKLTGKSKGQISKMYTKYKQV